MTNANIKNGIIIDELSGHQVNGVSGKKENLEVFLTLHKDEVEEYLKGRKEDLFLNFLVMREKVPNSQSEVLNFVEEWKRKGVKVDL